MGPDNSSEIEFRKSLQGQYSLDILLISALYTMDQSTLTRPATLILSNLLTSAHI